MPDGETSLLSREVSLCPACGALLPVPIDPPPALLTISRGRLAGAGCLVAISETGLLPWLRIDTPGRVIYRGREPGHWLTRKGATLLFAGPPVVVALLLAFGVFDPDILPLPGVVALLLMALVIYLLVRLAWKSRGDLSGRALQHAWARMAPQLSTLRFSPEESAFVAGLALQTIDLEPPPHQEGLERAIALTEQAVTDGRRAIRHLAALQRLVVADTFSAGGDAIPYLARQLGRCFEQRMQPSFAEELLAEWKTDPWTRDDQDRLRLLVCDHAFEAGFEVRHLIEAGQLVPLLAALLQTSDVEGLARLRLLWSLRASRPWDRCSPAATVFELAAASDGSKLLNRYPDLLLHQSVPLGRPRAGQREEDVDHGELLICGRGIVFEGVLFPRVPSPIEVISRGVFKRGGHQLVLGADTFEVPDDPEPLARLLERWFQYYFNDFQPRVAEVVGWQSPAGDRILRTWGTVACPKCRRIVRTKPGGVGVALEESADSPPV